MLHGVDGGHDVLEVVLHHAGLFHVPGLGLELVALTFVEFAALEDLEGFLLDGGFSRAVAHFGEFGLVALEFGVYGGEFYVDGFYSLVDLGS